MQILVVKKKKPKAKQISLQFCHFNDDNNVFLFNILYITKSKRTVQNRIKKDLFISYWQSLATLAHTNASWIPTQQRVEVHLWHTQDKIAVQWIQMSKNLAPVKWQLSALALS